MLTALLVAMMSIGLSSCNKDDDEDSSSKATVIDGKAYTTNYAWWFIQGSGKNKMLSLEFSNTDIYNVTMPPSRVYVLTLNIDNWEYSDIKSGTYTGVIEFWDMTIDASSNTTQYLNCLSGKVNVTITKDGDNYSISIPETTVNRHPNEANEPGGRDKVIGTVPFSFNYTGKISVGGRDSDR